MSIVQIRFFLDQYLHKRSIEHLFPVTLINKCFPILKCVFFENLPMPPVAPASEKVALLCSSSVGSGRSCAEEPTHPRWDAVAPVLRGGAVGRGAWVRPGRPTVACGACAVQAPASGEPQARAAACTASHLPLAGVTIFRAGLEKLSNLETNVSNPSWGWPNPNLKFIQLAD